MATYRRRWVLRRLPHEKSQITEHQRFEMPDGNATFSREAREAAPDERHSAGDDDAASRKFRVLAPRAKTRV
jgi:hypothetical protein